ncbi:hypothetical protein GQ53DRAFT_752966 [Thozetella sp. PMI_491]|nr:hypothetical protein GQ53DRAFT_752966 [Thozetella sp. PMI_491]
MLSGARDRSPPSAKRPSSRPPRGRGLRASTGCLTCRQRRIKCDECRPRCGRCEKADRECIYAAPIAPTSRTKGPFSTNRAGEHAPVPGASPRSIPVPDPRDGSSRFSGPAHPGAPATRDLPASGEPDRDGVVEDRTPLVAVGQVELDDNLGEIGLPARSTYAPPNPAAWSWPSVSPHDWYDLLVHDAIRNIERDNLSNTLPGWSFDKNSLSRRQSPVPSSPDEEVVVDQNQGDEDAMLRELSLPEPWNSPEKLWLQPQEVTLLQYYTDVVGPILDLFDPERLFSKHVPHLAMRNVGLLKSILAVAARHIAPGEAQVDRVYGDSNGSGEITSPVLSAHLATQYYYETLQYLSQNLLYPSYSRSREILATAMLISTYEMFDAQSTSDWERHLRGAFWIHRSQDNDGESADLFQRSIWWAWVRQDIWAAFRETRPTLTFWIPKKPLHSLTPDELCTRIVFLAAKCVEYSAGAGENGANSAGEMPGIAQRIARGQELLRDIEQWYSILPSQFQPLCASRRQEAASSTSSANVPKGGPALSVSLEAMFPPIWVHPPSHAAAIQTFHFARIVVLLNQPILGGIQSYRSQRKLLDESVQTICGIASTHTSDDAASAFVNVQATYAAGLCVEARERQAALLQLLKRALDVSKIPSSPLLDRLSEVWREQL